MNMNCEQAKHIKHSAFCGKDRSYDFIWFICRASCGTKVHPSSWVSRIYDRDLMSHTQVCTAAELATGGHRFRVRNLHFLTDTKLSYRMIKPTVHPHDWRPDENIRPWDQWDHSKLDQCTLSKIYRSTPCHRAAAFPAFQPKMMEHDADIGAVSVAEQKRPRQWGSMRITGNALAEVFIYLDILQSK